MKTFLIYAAVGVVMILLGLLSSKKAKAKSSRCSVPCTARIVRIDKDYTDHSDGNQREDGYIPIFAYTVNGQEYEARSNVATKKKDEYMVGDAANICYNPDRPSEFIVRGKSEKSSKGGAGILILLGLILIILGFTQMGA